MPIKPVSVRCSKGSGSNKIVSVRIETGCDSVSCWLISTENVVIPSNSGASPTNSNVTLIGAVFSVEI